MPDSRGLSCRRDRDQRQITRRNWLSRDSRSLDVSGSQASHTSAADGLHSELGNQLLHAMTEAPLRWWPEVFFSEFLNRHGGR